MMMQYIYLYIVYIVYQEQQQHQEANNLLPYLTQSDIIFSLYCRRRRINEMS